MSTPDPASQDSYDAFISYRRKDGARLARWIRRKLRRFRLPKEIVGELKADRALVYRRRPRVFIDQYYEKPSDDFLTKKIYPALDRSDRLIAIMTPSVFETIRDENGEEQQNWLVREIDRYLRSETGNSSERPLDVVLGPKARDDLFPGRLGGTRWDWIDLRAFSWFRSWGFGRRLDLGIAKLVAGVYDVPDRHLPALQREERRRRNRLLSGIATVAVVVAAVITALALDAVRKRDEALTDQSLRLAGLARQRIAEHDYTLAMLLSLEGLPDSSRLPGGAEASRRPYVPEAEYNLYASYLDGRERAILGGYDECLLGDDRCLFTDVSYSQDGRRFLAVSANKIRIWDASTYQELPPIVNSPDGRFTAAAFNADGTRIILGSIENRVSGTVQVWDIERSEVMWQTTAFNGEVVSLAFSPDGERASGVWNGEFAHLEVWDAATGANLMSYEPAEAKLYSVAFTPEGNVLTGSSAGKLRLQDGETPRVLWEISAAEGRANRPVLSAAVSNDGRLVVAAVGDAFQIWDVAAGTPTLRVSKRTPARRAAFSPDARRVVVVSCEPASPTEESCHGQVWDVENLDRDRAPIHLHGDSFRDAVFSPDGERIVTASEDGTARVWDASANLDRSRTIVRSTGLNDAALSPDGRSIATASTNGLVEIWDTGTGSLIRPLLSVGGEVRRVAYSPDGERLITVSSGGVHVLDAETGDIVQTLPHSLVNSAAFNPAGTLVVTGGAADGKARLWDVATGDLLCSIDDPMGAALNDVAFGPNGDVIAIASRNGTAQVWDNECASLRFDLAGHVSNASINGVAFSPDGALVATASADRKALVWNANTGVQLPWSLVHGGAVLGVVFSPSGGRIMTVSDEPDVPLHLWDTATGKEIAAFPRALFPGLQGRINSVAFGPNGDFVVVASDTGAWILSVFPTTQALVDASKDIAPRCLGAEERTELALPDQQPRWCLTGPGLEAETDPSRWQAVWRDQRGE